MAKSEVKSLAAKLVEIRRSLGKVEKTKRNPHFGYNYVGLEQLNALLEPKLSEHNVFFGTALVEVDYRYGDDAKSGLFASVITDHSYHDCDSKEVLTFRSAGLGWDTGDKATPKAITASLKAHLKALFMISDEKDDPEAHAERPQAAVSDHRQTTEYEHKAEKEEDKQGKEITDLMLLSTWMGVRHVPESFVLAMLVEKKLINANVKKLGDVQPAIIRRVLNEKSLENLLDAWKNSKVPTPPRSGEVRTNEGDQTQPEPRVFCKIEDITPDDYLDYAGYSDWRDVKVHFGKNRGTPLGKLSMRSLRWYLEDWHPEPYKGLPSEKDVLLDAALFMARAELKDHEQQGGGDAA